MIFRIVKTICEVKEFVKKAEQFFDKRHLVFVNGKITQTLDFLKIGDELVIMPIISGGSSRIPGAIATVVPAAGLITGGFGVRKPVILGVGDIKVLVEDEKITRGTIAGGKDVLQNTLYDTNSITRVGNSPGSSDWTQTTHWVASLADNSISWESGSDIPGSSTINQYGIVLTGDTSAPYNTIIPTNTGVWSTTNNYFVGGALTITNPDSSNYGTSKTITAYTGSTRQFVIQDFTYAINPNDTILVSLEPDEPEANQEYYVTYYKKLDSFDLTEYTAESDIKEAHGDIELSNSTDTTTAPNKLTIGALLALRNGAQSVIVGQLNYTSWGDRYNPTESEFNASLNMVLESLKEQIDYKSYVVPMATWTSSINNVWNHCKIMSAPENKGERTCIAGLVRGTTIAQFKSSGSGYLSSRMILIAPSEARFTDLVEVQMGGDVLAASYAGKRCFPTRISQTITGENLSGVTVETFYTPSQQRDLLGKGLAVLLPIAGIPTILHDKSTNVSTADTEENAVVEIADYLKRQTRETLWNIHKGLPIDALLLGSMTATMSRIFEVEINNQNIVEYKDVTAVQDASEPRLVRVNAKVKPAYPLVWIDITMSFYV